MENEVKEAAHKYSFISPDEYLEFERNSDIRNEYYDGLVLAMSGASLEHNFIDSNLVGTLHHHLKGKDCKVLPSHMRVSNPSRKNYLYPDASIVCGKPELEDDKFDTLTNPSVIFEVLSPSTQGADKSRKFFFYMKIPSLKEYIMIDSTKKLVLAARKQPDNSWKFDETNENEELLVIRSINLTIPLADIYEGTGL